MFTQRGKKPARIPLALSLTACLELGEMPLYVVRLKENELINSNVGDIVYRNQLKKIILVKNVLIGNHSNNVLQF